MLRHQARSIAVALLAGGLSACSSVGYLAQAAGGQWQVLRHRQPLARAIATADTASPLAAQLREAAEAREFASRELGLPDNASYRSYRALGRPYVVWNVVAAPAWSVEPLRWCFPIAGCVSYRGYFRETAARRYAARLAARGNDVLVGGVPAYSTLGRFNDPLLDTMLRHGDDYVAATIFHELAHQLVYVPGDSAFNEAFATAVEQVGMRRWLRARGREAALQRWEGGQALETAVAGAFALARSGLATLYGLQPAPADLAARKRARLAQLGEEVRALETAAGLSSGYGQWVEEGLNNAHLAAVATYQDCVPGFLGLLAAQGDDLPRFYAEVRRLAKRPAAERAKVCRPAG